MTLSTLLSESARECNKEVGIFMLGVMANKPDLARIINFLPSKQRAVIESVIAEVEGMKYQEHRMEKHMEAYVGGYDQALSDLISRLREALDTPTTV